MTIGISLQCRELFTKVNSPIFTNKMIATEDIPAGTVATFKVSDAAKLNLSQMNFKRSSSSFKYIKARDNRFLVEGCERSSSWVEFLTLAQDVQTESVRLDVGGKVFGDSILMLTLTKLLKKGQVMSVWFSSELASKLGFPFLNFSHVKDGQYVCAVCGTKFNSPNPLKLHMATSCDSIQGYRLWNRLQEECPSVPWSIPRLINSRLTSLDSTKNSAAQNSFPINSCSSVLKSAFRPVTSTSSLPRLDALPLTFSLTYQPISTTPVIQTPLMRRNSFDLFKWTPPLEPLSSSLISPYSSPQRPLQDPVPSTSAGSSYAAEVESLVSNLGRGKGNHLCIYCGKVYSRKYGLKIHIRTHTGYKPLKCRVCLRPFGDPSNLNKHIRLHAQGNTPYRCDLCGKVLVRKRDLDRHLRSRHSKDVETSSKTSVNSPPSHYESSDSFSDISKQATEDLVLV